MVELTQEKLKEFLTYDELIGEWRNLITRNHRARAGELAGCVGPDGYRVIKVLGRRHQSSHLAYLYMTGSWPAHSIDHINHVRSDDRWENLRPATHSQNMANKVGQRAMPKGVYRETRWKSKSFRAKIRFDRKTYSLGTFPTIEGAASAYQKAAVMHHGTFACFGQGAV